MDGEPSALAHAIEGQRKLGLSISGVVMASDKMDEAMELLRASDDHALKSAASLRAASRQLVDRDDARGHVIAGEVESNGDKIHQAIRELRAAQTNLTRAMTEAQGIRHSIESYIQGIAE